MTSRDDVVGRLDLASDHPWGPTRTGLVAAAMALADALRDVPRLRQVRGVRIVDTAGPSLVQSLIIPIAFQTDRLLLSHLGGGQTLAQYNLAAQMFNLLTQTVSVTGMAMWPHFAKARADGRVESPFGAASSFAAMGGALGLAMALVAPWAAHILSSGKIVLPLALLVANVANVVVEAAKQPLGMYMTDPRGLRAQMLPVIILVPMNLALSWVLITPLGAAGPIAGSVIAVIVCQLVPYALWVAHDLRRRRAKEAGDGLEHPEAAPRESHESLDEDPGEAVLAAARTGAGGPTSTPAGRYDGTPLFEDTYTQWFRYGRRNPAVAEIRPPVTDDPHWPPLGPSTPWSGIIDEDYFDGWSEPEFSWEEQIRQKTERTYLPGWGKGR